MVDLFGMSEVDAFLALLGIIVAASSFLAVYFLLRSSQRRADHDLDRLSDLIRAAFQPQAEKKRRPKLS